MKPKMIVLDLDGTTLNNKKILEPELGDYLQELRSRGILVCVATGRTIYETYYSFPKDFQIDGMINSNGMCVSVNDVEILKHSILPTTVTKLIEESLKYEIHHEIHHHDGRTSATISPMRERAHELTNHGYLNPVWTEEIHSEDVEKILFFKSEADIIQKWLNRLNELQQNLGFTAALSSPDLIDISGPLITKATGANAILDHVGLEFYDVIAFGDGGNDVPLFKKAGRSVAMANAPDWVKKQATEITEFSNNEQGLLKHLQLIFE
ncbi:MAG: Cof-type HAD-IIB family hydrolase [Kurthia sp.]|nr:Cof-type HAD-IIB family hydrolase [Candidatus Kurthia equi]